AHSKLSELFGPATKKCVSADHERCRSQLDQIRECGIKVTIGTCMENVDLNPECAGRRLHVSRLGLCKNGAGWIEQQTDHGRRRHQLMYQLQLFRSQQNA